MKRLSNRKHSWLSNLVGSGAAADLEEKTWGLEELVEITITCSEKLDTMDRNALDGDWTTLHQPRQRSDLGGVTGRILPTRRLVHLWVGVLKIDYSPFRIAGDTIGRCAISLG
jgi:hypothetical protein